MCSAHSHSPVLACVLKNLQIGCFKNTALAEVSLLLKSSDPHHCLALIKLQAHYLLRHYCLIYLFAPEGVFCFPIVLL